MCGCLSLPAGLGSCIGKGPTGQLPLAAALWSGPSKQMMKPYNISITKMQICTDSITKSRGVWSRTGSLQRELYLGMYIDHKERKVLVVRLFSYFLVKVG